MSTSQSCWAPPAFSESKTVGVTANNSETLASLTGLRNCCNVFFDVPVAWYSSSGATIRVYVRNAGLRQLVVETSLATLHTYGGGSVDSAGVRYTGIAAVVTGLAAETWEVEVVSTGAQLSGGKITLLGWGDTSAPFKIVAPMLSDALPNPQVDGAGAYLLGWDPTNGASGFWERVQVRNGRILVQDEAYSFLSASTALEASHQVGLGAGGTMTKIAVRIDKTAPTLDYYIQFFDSVALPVDGTAVTSTMLGPECVQHTVGLHDEPALEFTVRFTTNLWVVLSSTAFTKTIAGAYMQVVAAEWES